MTRTLKTLSTIGSGLVLALAAFVLLVQQHVLPEPTARAQAGDDAFWNPLRVSGDEVERFDVLADMAKAADLVVTGRVTGYRINRKLQGDTPEDVVVYAALDIAIEKVLRGTAPGKTVPVELLLPHRPDRIEGIVSKQREALPKGELLLILRHKGGAERGLYRLVESRGLWVSERGTLRAPLAKEPVPEEAPALTPVAVLEQNKQDRGVLDDARVAGKISDGKSHPGFKPAVRPTSTAQLDQDVAVHDDSEEPELTYRKELQGKTSIAELSSIVRP